MCVAGNGGTSLKHRTLFFQNPGPNQRSRFHFGTASNGSGRLSAQSRRRRCSNRETEEGRRRRRPFAASAVEDQPMLLLPEPQRIVQPRRCVSLRARRGGAPPPPRQHVGPDLRAREESTEDRVGRKARRLGGSDDDGGRRGRW